MKFKVGDKVRDLYSEDRRVGNIVDAMTGANTGEVIYLVEYNGFVTMCRESWIDLVEEPAKYRFEIDIADAVNNVVIATMIETRGGVEKEICRNHGHVIHEGALGIAQAASYALRCIYKKLEDECDA